MAFDRTEIEADLDELISNARDKSTERDDAGLWPLAWAIAVTAKTIIKLVDEDSAPGS